MSSKRKKKSREVDEDYEDAPEAEEVEEQSNDERAEGEGDAGAAGAGAVDDAGAGAGAAAQGNPKPKAPPDPSLLELDTHDEVRSFPLDPSSLTPMAQQEHLDFQGWKGKRELVQLICPYEGAGIPCQARVMYFYAVSLSLPPKATYTSRLSNAQLRNNKNLEKAWRAHEPHCVSVALCVHLPRVL